MVLTDLPVGLQKLRRTLPEVGHGEGAACSEVVLLPLREVLPELRPHRLDGVQVTGVRREVDEDEPALRYSCGCMRNRSLSCQTLAWTLRRGSPARSTARLSAGTRCAHPALFIFGRGVHSRSVKWPRPVNPPTEAP